MEKKCNIYTNVTLSEQYGSSRGGNKLKRSLLQGERVMQYTMTFNHWRLIKAPVILDTRRHIEGISIRM